MDAVRMTVRLLLTVAALMPVATLGQGAPASAGQDYPSKTIRMVAGGPGTGGDLIARMILPALSALLGQQVIVVNFPSGFVPGETVSRAPPDGYTLLSIASTLWLGPLIQKTPYDGVRDFAPVTLVGMSPQILVVHPSLPVRSAKDLIALAKARPGELNFASGATGSGGHLAAELFKSMAGIKMVRIPYTSGSARTAALMSGEVQLEFLATGSALSYIKSGRLRGLAVTSAEPSALVPGLPTIAASGLPGYASTSKYAIFAPAKTPVAVLTRLSQDIARTLKAAETREKFLNAGIEVVGSTPEQLAAQVKSDIARMDKVIREAALRAQ